MKLKVVLKEERNFYGSWSPPLIADHQDAWLRPIWNLAIYRSVQIWNALSVNEIRRSVGNISDYGKRSIGSKLNPDYMLKRPDGKWQFVKMRYCTVPLTESAIQICRKRAKKYAQENYVKTTENENSQD